MDFSRLYASEEHSDIALVFLQHDANGSPEPIFIKRTPILLSFDNLLTSRIEIRAHRVVLAMHSEPFYLMFVNPMRESAQRRVELFDVRSIVCFVESLLIIALCKDPDVFELFLEFLYTGKISNLGQKYAALTVLSTSHHNQLPLQITGK